MTIKLQAVVEDKPESFEYGNMFTRENAGGRERLRVGLNNTQDGCVRLLSAALAGPFQLLYVLHTTRTGAELGRYESPELSAALVHAFFQEFGRFLCEDSRHDVWLRSHDDDATVVLDRHNLIYAYGPLDAFEAALPRLGARRGRVPEIPDAHMHYYHQGWDESERQILRALPWQLKPLRPSEVQWDGGERHPE